MYETFIHGPSLLEISPVENKLYRYCKCCGKKHFSKWIGGESANPANAPHLFNEDHTKYTGNDTVLKTTTKADKKTIMYVFLVGDGHFQFEYGAFCSLRCGETWANKRLGAERQIKPEDIKRKIIGEPSI